MITLHKLALFRVVYTEGSFNRAAKSLYLAQSVVSQHIHDLEIALGTSLFQRTSRGVKPTEAADLLYDYAGKMLNLLSEAERAIAQVDGLADRSLTVAATPGVSVYLLPRWLNSFREQHPNINVNLQTALTIDVIRDVLTGRYDLGFIEAELSELEQHHLGCQPVRVVEYFVVVSAGHPWVSRDEVSLDELLTQRFVTRQPNSRARKWLERILGSAASRLKIVAEVDSPGAIKFALLNGMGVAILPDYVIDREVERGELFRMRLTDYRMERTLLMLWDKQHPFTPIQRAFVESLTSFAPQVRLLL